MLISGLKGLSILLTIFIETFLEKNDLLLKTSKLI